MAFLILGVALFTLAHLFTALARSARAKLVSSLGEKAYKGLFALTNFIAIVLIVWGWWQTPAVILYSPPEWGRTAALVLMIVAFVLLGAAGRPTVIRHYVRHPMLSGVVVWSIAHLLANDEVRTTVLFGGLGAWALISIFAISARDGEWIKPKRPSMMREIIGIVASFVVLVVVILLHPYFTGMAAVTH